VGLFAFHHLTELSHSNDFRSTTDVHGGGMDLFPNFRYLLFQISLNRYSTFFSGP